jgi:hypothetical protein
MGRIEHHNKTSLRGGRSGLRGGQLHGYHESRERPNQPVPMARMITGRENALGFERA